MKTGSILLSAMLKATSNLNILKYSHDADRKKHARTELIGPIVLYVFLLAYCVATSIGFGVFGLAEAIPQATVFTIALISFFLTIIKTNGYLFNFKEYDMLIAMPIPIGTVAAAKFMYMYVKSLPVMVITSISMMIGYGIYVKPGFGIYLLWIVQSLVIPLLPMILASALGALFAKIGSGFKHKKLIQTILIFLIVILIFCLRFILEAVFRNDEAEIMMENLADAVNSASGVYIPARWFASSISKGNILYAVLFVAVSIGAFILFAVLISRSYRQINSALSSSGAHTNFHMNKQNSRSTVNAITFKEFKRFTGSIAYITNIGMGNVFAILLGLAAIFVDADKAIATVLQGAPITKEMLMPSIPLIVYFFLGMVPSTCCSLSLEGQNYWIIQSMPINPMDLYRGKLRFNLLLTVPFMAFDVITLSLSVGAPLIDTLLYLICGTVLLIFSSCFGMRCNLKHIKLDWKNEIEVIKQGTAIVAYLLPNMVASMALIAGVVALGRRIDSRLVILIITVISGILAFLSYRSIKRNAGQSIS